jgi:hypothetical protein
MATVMNGQQKAYMRLVFALLWSNWTIQAHALTVLINEVMTSNSSVAADPQKHFDDWIELYNPGRSAIDLAGLYLTNDSDNPGLWQIPLDRPDETVIPARGHVVIWADSEPEDQPGLHAGFKLNAGGDRVLLFDRDGQTLIDYTELAHLNPDLSYGRFPDGNPAWEVMPLPSPGATNQQQLIEGIVATVQFSQTRGFYEEPIAVTLSTGSADATIRYTTDGTEPGMARARGFTGTVYSCPITIKRTTCLRAKALKPNWRPSTTRTQTYLFLDDIIRQSAYQPGYPKQWGSRSADYAMDTRIVNDPVYRHLIKGSLQSHRSLSIACEPGALFDDQTGIYIHAQNAGIAWERAVSMEIIDPHGEAEVQVNAGLRMQGGASRSPSRAKHNMRLLFKGQYGTTKLRYPLFENWPISEFDTLVLRGGNGDSWFHPNTTQQRRAQYIRDQWCRDTQTYMGQVTAGQCYIHLYLNGLYWGLYHVIERPNAAFFAEHFGGREEDYDVLQHKNGTVDGNRKAWNEMMAIANSGLVDHKNYAALQQYMDIPNLIDYMILNFYVGNVDWDHNNWYGGRRRQLGEGFKFFMWDSERTILSLNDNVTDKNNSNQPSAVHQNLARNADYRTHFADHVFRHFFGQGALTPGQAAARWSGFAEKIRLPLFAESARWGDAQRATPYTPYAEWQAELDFLQNDYFPNRTRIVLDQLRARGLYPPVNPPRLIMTENGPTALILTLETDEGQVIYTTDGSDPRPSGTGRSASSIGKTYSHPITLSQSTRVKARTLAENTWSALAEAAYTVGPIAEALRVSEIMYHPADEAPNTEFIELMNTGTVPINLNLVQFTQGIRFTFDAIDLPPQQRILVVQDINAYEAYYGVSDAVVGQYQGRLNNGGERITLTASATEIIQAFEYNDKWFAPTDGDGRSLIVTDPWHPDPNVWNQSSAWEPSGHVGGSPGY